MDPLSDVLSLLKPQSYMLGGIDADGDWSFQGEPPYDCSKCVASVSVHCWLAMDGEVDAASFEPEATSCRRPFRFESGLTLTPVGLQTVQATEIDK